VTVTYLYLIVVLLIGESSNRLLLYTPVCIRRGKYYTFTIPKYKIITKGARAD